MKKIFIIVTGMSCAACSASVERAVNNLDGVVSASVNLTSGKLTVIYNEETLSQKDIENAVTRIGFGVNYDTLESNLHKKSQEVYIMKKKLIFSACFAIPLFYISMGHMVGLPVPGFMNPTSNGIVFALVQMFLSIGCMVAGYKFYVNGIRNLFTLKPNMDSLVAVGTLSAFIYGIVLIFDMLINKTNHAHNLYFESVGVIVTLIMLGKYLENRSKLKTNDAIVKLMELAPPVATVIRNGEKLTVAVEDVVIGDIVAVSPGEKIPVDGVVSSGRTTVDESMLTGESIPVEKEAGSKVYAGCINKNGYVEIQTGVSNENTLISKIVAMVEEASGSKPEIARLADKICAVFVPCVIGAALITALIWVLIGAGTETVLNRFISVLVVACPCSLGLATPTAVIVAVGRAASEGILVKDAASMERLNSVDTFVFDKTGTLTNGEPSVEDFFVYPDFDENEVLRFAVSLEAISEHPLSDAVCAYGTSKGVKETGVNDFEVIVGKGVKGVVEGRSILLGSKLLMEENNVSGNYTEVVNEYTSQGKTIMLLSVDGSIAAVIAARDTLKPDSAKAVSLLNNNGMKTILLTGDNSLVAEVMAKETGISECISEVLPGQKADKIKELMANGRKVSMIGDGINDSVALTVADVGIAVGSASEIALEAADIVVMKDNLTDIVKAKNISKLCLRNIKQNLFYAFIYNTVLIPLAAGALTFAGISFNPMVAASAMALSSVSVVLNALRLKKIKICDE